MLLGRVLERDDSGARSLFVRTSSSGGRIGKGSEMPIQHTIKLTDRKSRYETGIEMCCGFEDERDGM